MCDANFFLICIYIAAWYGAELGDLQIGIEVVRSLVPILEKGCAYDYKSSGSWSNFIRHLYVSYDS